MIRIIILIKIEINIGVPGNYCQLQMNYHWYAMRHKQKALTLIAQTRGVRPNLFSSWSASTRTWCVVISQVRGARWPNTAITCKRLLPPWSLRFRINVPSMSATLRFCWKTRLTVTQISLLMMYITSCIQAYPSLYRISS